MDEHRLMVLGLIIACLIAGVLLFQHSFGGPPPKKGPSSTVQGDAVSLPHNIGKPPSEDCGEVVQTCLASAETRIRGCTERAAREALLGQLGQPLETPDCKAAQEAIEERCPLGCRPDFTTLLSIPGTLSVKVSSVPDEFGRCLARIERPVTLRVSCR